jgi:hypothetical protein
MSFDLWHQWLLFRPLGVFLVTCPLLILAALVGWSVGRRQATKRAAKAGAAQAPTAAQSITNRPQKVATSEEPAPRPAEWAWPREWDGGQPRPNWNRFSG